MGVNKIITNANKSSIIKFDNSFYAKVIPCNGNDFLNIEVYGGNKKIIFINNEAKEKDISVFKSYEKVRFPKNFKLNSFLKNSDYSNENSYNLYVIIFDRVIRVY
jgi:competence protein ComEC